jgi:N-acetylglucosamine-6-phosphate deacetylase
MLILKNNELVEFDGNLFQKDGTISFVDGEKIKINEHAKYIVPGFVDQHIHGVANVDAMDNDETKLHVFSEALVKEGTTSFLPTTMTYDLGVVKEVITKVSKVASSVSGANIVGVHLEGPFLSPKFIGAQNPIYIQSPNVEMFKLVNVDDMIKLVTYAPEEDDNYEFTKYLAKNNIIASIGHSAATCHEANEAIANGASNFTHFHNASTGHHHRTPGVVTSGLENRDIKVELIVDGIHLHPDAVKATYKIKGYENIILITDSIRAKGCEDGIYDLGGQNVYKKGFEARLEDGTLAGSILEMNVGIKNMIEFSGCTPQEAFIMASFNPAKHLGLTTKGLIQEGYDCDITVLDENFNVLQTFVNGGNKYEKGEQNGN